MTPLRALAAALILAGCSPDEPSGTGEEPAEARRLARRPLTLWAWHGRQELSSIDPERVGVAYLARELTVGQDSDEVRLRRAPVHVPEGTQLTAVVHVELAEGASPGQAAPRRPSLIQSLLEAASEPDVVGLQLDFDAPRSWRPFYVELLRELRERLPEDQALSMTALGSWCVGDRWLDQAEADEVVPMLFSMGPEGPSIRAIIAREGQLPEPRCQGPLGLSLTDPESLELAGDGPIFLFSPGAWTEEGYWRAKGYLTDNDS